MDWNIFWSAFGAIGTTFGSLITAVAVIVAVYQYRQPFVKKVKTNFSVGIPIMTNNACGNLIFTICVSNTGIRDIEVTNIYLNIGSKNLVLNNVCMMDVSFPQLLEQEKSLSMYIPCASVAAQMASMVASGEINEKTKVKVLTTDSSGKQYYFKTKYSVESIIKHLSN